MYSDASPILSSERINRCQVFTRRQLFQGDLSGQNTPVRPPWALAEMDFLSECQRCLDCASYCPTNIIFHGSGGYPEINFEHDECTFCGDCVKACTSGALSEEKFSCGSPAWAIKASFSDDCLAAKQIVCQICAEQCDALAIRFIPKIGGVASPELQTELCNGCGACVAPCPVHAIQIKDPGMTEVTR